MKPRIAITLGDPAGIGPEIVAKALRDPRVRRACEPIVVGKVRRLCLGRPSQEGGRLAIEALKRGVDLVRAGEARALVTAPVSKESFRLAGHGFPGHTEWLAKQCGTPMVAMLMVAGPLRAVLMTRHVPLVLVSRHLTPNIVKQSARLGYQFLTDVIPATSRPVFYGSEALLLERTGGREAGIHHKRMMDSRPPHDWAGAPDLWRARFRGNDKKPTPRIVLCGLNPHAGDHGLIGKEEKTIFLPAIKSLRKEGIPVAGPLPADSVFPQMARGQYDLALAAYHDQGMIPLKLYAPDRVVNITLGLPFIRTSPGHGTAYDIAGKGKADPRPMVEAILLAARYSK